MAQKHFDKIIENVKQLLLNKNWKAIKLCEITGIPQPQMSKVLNGKAQFTFDQIISVAEAFNVSIDFLVGRYELSDSVSIPTNREIFEFISSLLENNVLRSIDIDVEEECYVPYEGFEEYHYPYEYKKLHNQYKSFYFSNYFPVLSLEEFEKLDPYEQEEYKYDIETNGNDNTRNMELNDYLSYYEKLYDIKKNANMDENIYNTAIHDRLDKLKY